MSTDNLILLNQVRREYEEIHRETNALRFEERKSYSYYGNTPAHYIVMDKDITRRNGKGRPRSKRW